MKKIINEKGISNKKCRPQNRTRIIQQFVSLMMKEADQDPSIYFKCPRVTFTSAGNVDDEADG